MYITVTIYSNSVPERPNKYHDEPHSLQVPGHFSFWNRKKLRQESIFVFFPAKHLTTLARDWTYVYLTQKEVDVQMYRALWPQRTQLPNLGIKLMAFLLVVRGSTNWAIGVVDRLPKTVNWMVQRISKEKPLSTGLEVYTLNTQLQNPYHHFHCKWINFTACQLKHTWF